MIDLVRMKAHHFDDDELGSHYRDVDIPPELRGRRPDGTRAQLLEACAEHRRRG